VRPEPTLDLTPFRAYSRAMIRRWFLSLCLAAALPTLAQDEMSLDDLLEQGREWAEENLDDQVLKSLDQIDDTKVGNLLRELQRRFESEYVLDLAGPRGAASHRVQVLEAGETTRPYGAWLKTRMDYFVVVEELKPSTPETRQNPTAQQERTAWKKQLEKRPIPPEAKAYLNRLKPVFAAGGIPEELVWLAEVESSFDRKAVSPSGAAGLFQLMPGTARDLGLSVRPRDERLDPEKSAGAAAKHLAYLYGRFKDWPLSVAAYNCGEGRLRKTMDRYKASTYDAVAPRLPAETQLYVPKIEAVLQRREGKALSGLPAPGP
jgi:membrane-bound lytic murein transglycosylase D